MLNHVCKDMATQSEDDYKFPNDLSLDKIREMQYEFAKERDWCQFHTPRNIMLALVGEIGELSEIFQWRGEVEKGLPDWSPSDREHLGEELSDVLIYLVKLAQVCHVDLPSAVVRKMELNKEKYPVKFAYGSSLKYNQYKDKEVEDKDNKTETQ